VQGSEKSKHALAFPSRRQCEALGLSKNLKAAQQMKDKIGERKTKNTSRRAIGIGANVPFASLLQYRPHGYRFWRYAVDIADLRLY